MLSEWQDLNLRPPRPEGGGTRAVDQTCQAVRHPAATIAPEHEIELRYRSVVGLPLAKIAFSTQCRRQGGFASVTTGFI